MFRTIHFGDDVRRAFMPPSLAPEHPIVAIVDDDPSVRKGLSRLLRLAGFEVTTYNSGEDLLKCPAESLPACIVVDIHLGGLTGIEVKSLLDQGEYHVPVIFMTADDDTSERIVPCLRKPFSGASLIAMILDALR